MIFPVQILQWAHYICKLPRKSALQNWKKQGEKKKAKEKSKRKKGEEEEEKSGGVEQMFAPTTNISPL